MVFSDVFVVLDNVLFRKRHYFDRTRIINMHGEIMWLSLPVGQNFGKCCNEVDVRPPDSTYVQKIIKTIEFSYGKARFFDVEWQELKSIIEKPLLCYSHLVDVNMGIIVNLLNYIGIDVPDIHFSSHLVGAYEDPTDRLIAICTKLGINELVIGGGMSIHIHDYPRLLNEGISLYIQDYLDNHPIYEQSRRKRVGFRKGLSIVDAILNVGKNRTREFLIDQRYSPTPMTILQ